MTPQVITVPAGLTPGVQATFRLTKAVAGAILDQRPGDRVAINLARDSFNGSDTCNGAVTVYAVKVTYTVK